MSRDVPSVALWMPWFIKDHRARVMTLSHLEHSAAVYLSMLFWERDGSLPDDDRAIAKSLRLTVAQWKAMRSLLLADCTVSGGFITHPGTVVEIEKARKNIRQKSIAGKASADARAAQRLFNGCSTAVGTAGQPRAGGGGGEGSETHPLPRQKLFEGDTRASARDGLTIIAGGAK